MAARKITEIRDLTVQLPSGGNLEVRIRVDWSKIDEHDGQFIDQIVRSMFALGDADEGHA